MCDKGCNRVENKHLFSFRLEPNPEYWEGKRGACAGVLYGLASKTFKGVSPNGVPDVLALLRDSSNQQAEQLIKTIRKNLNCFR